MKPHTPGRHQLVELAVDQIRGYAANPRLHPPAQIAALKHSIERFGFNAPVPVSEDRKLIAGHGRLQAARELGLVSLPALVLADPRRDAVLGRRLKSAEPQAH